MNGEATRTALTLGACALLACDAALPGPPPLPLLPKVAAEAPPADASTPPPRKPAARASAARTRDAVSTPKRPRTAAPSPDASRPPAGAWPAPVQTAPAKVGPAPVETKTRPAAPRATKRTPVVVPSSVHLRAELPPGLQADLDADPRMQSWLDGTFAVIEQCHAGAQRPSGSLDATLTMHESARPDLALGTLQPALAPVVACATGSLLRAARMPLFTGREGTRYSVRLIFQ